jgi:hypothetical protein
VDHPDGAAHLAYLQEAEFGRGLSLVHWIFPAGFPAQYECGAARRAYVHHPESGQGRIQRDALSDRRRHLAGNVEKSRRASLAAGRAAVDVDLRDVVVFYFEVLKRTLLPSVFQKGILLVLSICMLCKVSFSQQWNDVGGGADNQVESTYLDTTFNLLYVGGHFDYLGLNAINQIGIWNGSSWSAVGTNERFKYHSFSGHIGAITQFNGNIVAAGLFDSIGNIPAKNIGLWNGTVWQSMGNGFDDLVTTLQVFNGELYAGGQFNHSGVDTVYYISKWNGSNWVRLSQGWGLDNAVAAMTVFENKLVICGSFDVPFQSSITGSGVITWDGSNWDSIGVGFNHSVVAVKVINDTLYAGGDFTGVASNPSNYISRWDGNAWQSMPYPSGGSQPKITDIAFFLGELYVCGFFTSPPDIGRFNGINYDSIGNAFGFINKMIVYNNELYVSGGFSSINGIPFSNIASYNISNSVDETDPFEQFNIYPNPIAQSQVLNFQFNDEGFDHEIEIISSDGRMIEYRILSGCFSRFQLTDALKPGLYFISVKSPKKVKHSMKLIVF